MPDLSTVVNMFFGADNNKVLYALIILVTLDYITGDCDGVRSSKYTSGTFRSRSFCNLLT